MNGTPTGRTPACRLYPDNDHNRIMCPGCAPTPGSTTGGDMCTCGESKDDHRGVPLGQNACMIAALRADIADARREYDEAAVSHQQALNIVAADLAAALKREGEARDKLLWQSACTKALLESQARLAKDAREARERAIEECAAACERLVADEIADPLTVNRVGAYRDAVDACRDLAPVPTAEAAKEPTPDPNCIECSGSGEQSDCDHCYATKPCRCLAEAVRGTTKDRP